MKQKIRFALVVGESGNWAVGGWSPVESEDELMDVARQSVDEEVIAGRYWIEAEVEIPEGIPVIQGTVSKEE